VSVFRFMFISVNINKNKISFVIVYSKKLSYRTRTARHSMSVNSCDVSRATGVIKDSNSKSEIQGHSRALAMVPFDRPHTISY